MSLSGFRIPDVSSDIPYPEFDDVFATALLEANGASLDDDALTAALDSPIEVLRAAAARTLGARGVRSAIGRLETAAVAGDGTDRAEAAYALARMGETEAGILALRACLELPADWSIAAIQAAGMLARLGDPSGVSVVLRALKAKNSILRTVAVKQLFWLASLDGVEVEGRRVDPVGLLEEIARARDEEVAHLARMELRDLRLG